MCALNQGNEATRQPGNKGNPNPERERRAVPPRAGAWGSVSLFALFAITGGPNVRAEEVISRAWTVQNVLEPTFTEAISRADTVQNVLQPTFDEAISRAVSPCNIGLFTDDDGDTVHDCFDDCPGGNDLVDADGNDIPDACEPGSCCFITEGFPGCFNSNKLECESPPFNGVYGGEGSVCDQNVAIIREPNGTVFVHQVGPPADCGPGTPTECRGIAAPPYIDAWKTANTIAHSFSATNGGTPIPAGFFGAGSDAYEGSVSLQGVSLNDPAYPGADTLIRRHADPFDICTPGAYPIEGDPVPIEIIALSLANPTSAPITVTYNGGNNPELWDATVIVGGPAPMGFLAATKEHCNGGTYTSVLNVLPQFTFRRRSNGALRGLIPPTHMTFNQTEPAPWVHDVNPVFDASIDPCSQFHAGFDNIVSPLVCGDDPDGDNIRVECDNCPDHANATQEDCDNDGVGDVCALAACAGSLPPCDCNDNLRPDNCDVADQTSADVNGNERPDECEIPPQEVLADAQGDKVRFISFTVPASMTPVAQSGLRIVLVSLHHVNPPYSGGPSIPFASFEGQVRWVGPPTQYVESGSNPILFYAAQLQCAPHYLDWSTLGLLHVTGSAIAPSSHFEVENTSGVCAGTEDNCFGVSAALAVSTRRWGDVAFPFNPPSPTVQPDISDVSQLVDKFRSAPGAPIKARGILAGAPGNPFGVITHEVLNVDFSFSHISACVDAFRGVPYPYTIAACP